MTKGTGSPLYLVNFSRIAYKMPHRMPVMYNPIITTARHCRGKNAVVNRA